VDNAVIGVAKAAQAMVDAEIALTQYTFGVGKTESHPHPIEMMLVNTEIRAHQAVLDLQPNFYPAVSFIFRSEKIFLKNFINSTTFLVGFSVYRVYINP